MISIIIPVYNVSSYIDTCLESVVNQIYTDWECILINDGSKDNSGNICDNWAKNDYRIHVIHQINQGVSAARNRGIQESKGEFITFIDSDDWINKTYLYDLINGIKDSRTDLVVSGLIQEYKDGKNKKFVFPNSVTYEISSNHILEFIEMNKLALLYGPVAKLYKSSIIKNNKIEFPLDYSYGEDLIFNYQYLDYIHRISNIPVINYHYRIIGKGTLSSIYRENQFDIDYSQWKLLQNFYCKKNIWDYISKEYMYQRLWGIVYDGIFSCKKINYTHLKKILSIKEIKELSNWIQNFNCARWIKIGILHRCWYLFYLYLKLFKIKQL